MHPKLSSYEKKILSIFTDSYPKSAQFRGGQKLRKANWEKVFPGIEKSLEKKNMFLAAIEHLTDLKIISARWKRFREGDILEALYLENPSLLYSTLCINSPELEREIQLKLLNDFNPTEEWKIQFKNYIANKLDNMDIIPVSNSSELEQILSLLSINQEHSSKIPLRALSVQLFNNSKRLESILPKLDRLSAAVCDFKFSEKYKLERLFPETTISGQFNIIFKDDRIWTVKGDIITLPAKTLAQIKNIEFKDKNPEVLSIENKESFYTIPINTDKFSAFIYCSGHLNDADKMLFKILANNTKIFHAGDLDPDGLLIFGEIDSIVNEELTPFFMDVGIYEEYSRYGYLLEKQSLKRLDAVKNKKLFDLVSIMRDKKVGIEQEIIDYFT